MKPVTLYTANRKRVHSHSGYIPIVSSGPVIRSSNSSDMFLSHEIKVDHLLVMRFCFTQEDGSIEDRFVAFDRELEEIIDVMLGDYTRDLHAKHQQDRQNLLTSHIDALRVLESRTIWDMIKIKFSNWWLK